MPTMPATLELIGRAPAREGAPVNLSGLTREQLQEALVASGAVAPDKARMRAAPAVAVDPPLRPHRIRQA